MFLWQKNVLIERWWVELCGIFAELRRAKSELTALVAPSKLFVNKSFHQNLDFAWRINLQTMTNGWKPFNELFLSRTFSLSQSKITDNQMPKHRNSKSVS